MEKIEVILVKGKETTGTYVYEEPLGEIPVIPWTIWEP
jgi:hypothetical protein